MIKNISLFILLFAFNNVRSQDIIWKGNKNFIDVANKVSVLEDKAGNLTINEVSSEKYNGLFKLSNQSVLHFGFTQSVYWLKFSIENNTTDSLWLELDHAFIPSADLYFKGSTGGWQIYKAGYEVNLNEKTIKDHNQLFPLQRGKNIYYIRMLPYVHPIPVRVWKSKTYQIKTSKQRMIYGIYAGILLFAIAINMFLFFALKKRYYFLYSVLVFLYICSSAAVMEGYIIYFFPKIDLMYWYKIIPVLDMPALLFYLVSFLELKKYTPGLYKFSVAACVYLFVHLILIQFLPLMCVILLNYMYALLVFILAIYMGVTIGKKGQKIGYYFTIAYSIWFVLILLDEIYIQFGVPAHIFELSYVSIAIFIEAFLLAFLQAKRFQWERQTDERIKLDLENNIGQMQEKFKQELLQTQLEIQEQTLKTISQEIHDNVGQVLSLAKLNLNTLENGAEQKINDTKKLVSKAISDLRNLSRSMHGDRITELGLQQSIDDELQLLQNSGQFETELIITGNHYKMLPQKETLLFRIVQEALNNAVKHSKAKQLKVHLYYMPELFKLTITDDGIGFDAATLPLAKKGIGLTSMRNRAELIGGIFHITSELNNGTQISITLTKEANF